MKDVKVSELTVSQLQRLIKRTVQQAVAEVIIEFSALREVEDDVDYETELSEYLRHSLAKVTPALSGTGKRDD